MKQKMSFKKIVLSKEGVKREQKGSKEALGLEHVAVRWGERGAYATLDPCLRRILT